MEMEKSLQKTHNVAEVGNSYSCRIFFIFYPIKIIVSYTNLYIQIEFN